MGTAWINRESSWHASTALTSVIFKSFVGWSGAGGWNDALETFSSSPSVRAAAAVISGVIESPSGCFLKSSTASVSIRTSVSAKTSDAFTFAMINEAPPDCKRQGKEFGSGPSITPALSALPLAPLLLPRPKMSYFFGFLANNLSVAESSFGFSFSFLDTSPFVSETGG